MIYIDLTNFKLYIFIYIYISISCNIYQIYFIIFPEMSKNINSQIFIYTYISFEYKKKLDKNIYI